MSIKNKIKFKIDRDRGTNPATGVSLDLSDDGQPSNDSRRPLGESARRSVSQDDIDYQGGGAYKAILKLFSNQLDDEKFAEHCKKFFKGESGETSGPAQTMTQKQTEEKT